MNLLDMQNLYVGIEKNSNNPFTIPILADSIEEAQEIVNEYASDAGFESFFEVSSPLVGVDYKFDCDYILSKADIRNLEDTQKSIEKQRENAEDTQKENFEGFSKAENEESQTGQANKKTVKKPQKQCIEVVDCCERSVVYGFFEGCFDVKEIQEAIYGIKNTFENNEIEWFVEDIAEELKKQGFDVEYKNKKIKNYITI